MTQPDEPKRKEPGHYLNQGIALGIALGVAFGAALGNVGLGIGLGIAIGVAIGTSMEENAKKRGEMRALSEDEKQQVQKRERTIVLVGLTLAAIVVAAVLALIFFTK